MTTGIAGLPVIEGDKLISTNPVTGAEVGRFPAATAGTVDAAVERAREAAQWWAGLGFAGRKARLLRWNALIARQVGEMAELINRESGKPVAEAVVEITVAAEHVAWAARHAERVLGPRREKTTLLLSEFSAFLAYLPYGVVGVIGPWNYPIFTPIGSIAYALAAGNTVVFKPSEYTPAVGQWLVDRFAEVVPEHPVLQIVHGTGEAGAALSRAAVDKIAFTGSTRTAKKIMAACAERLTPVLLECGGKDAMLVDVDADVDAAVDACVWGGLTNAGQTCIGIERVYVAAPVYDIFLSKLVARATRLKVGADRDSDIGPITMPPQVDIIRDHIADALRAGGHAVLGGTDAVQPPYVYPTILTDVPEDSVAVREETFGPVLVVNRVSDIHEGVRRANASRYGLGGSVFGRRNAILAAGQLRSGMTSVNSALTFAGMSTLPFGGVGDSGFGRIHGDDGLREFTTAKAITKRRAPSVLPSMTFDRTARSIEMIKRLVRVKHGRSR